MRIFGKHAVETQKTEKIKITTHHPVTNEVLHGVELDKFEAREAVAWLREHNGHAPLFVHSLIDGMEIALNLQWEKRI